MSFDGIPRPSQLQPYGDPLGAHIGANQAADQSRRKPRIGKTRESFSVDPVHKELEQYPREDDEEQEAFSDEEREQLLVFAKLRGIMNFSLENGVLYRFTVNETSGLVD